ncbi:hypothetical protein [Candidatus Nitrososphaera sp. FF02]|uniref:hypothetical protein n=1 Tax=Candidatus Nitrososphaera sp. FF02 TaxID=3398226 RepID=UPI0039EBA4F6
MIIVVGYFTYLVHDYSDISVLLTLVMVILLTRGLYWWSANRTSHDYTHTTIDVQNLVNKNMIIQSLRSWIPSAKKQPISIIIQVLLAGLLIYGFATMVSVRTSESIASPWDVIPIGFFISYVLGISILFYAVLRNKLTMRKSIPFLFFFYLLPALAFTIILENPFTGVNVMYSEGNRQLSNYGRFVSDPSQEEALSSPIGKSLLQVGGHFLDVVFAKYLQVDPFVISLYSIPIIFCLLTVISLYAISSTLKPYAKAFSVLLVLAFFYSQHNIFIFTPPGKPETLALGFLITCLFLSLNFLKSTSVRTIVPLIIITFCSFLIHQYVGLVGLFALAVVVILKYLPRTKPVHRILKPITLGLVILTPSTIMLPILDQISGFINVEEEKFSIAGSFDPVKTTDVLFPPFKPANSTNIFDVFVNNFHYVFYGIVALGFLAGIITNVDREFLVLFAVLLAICMQMVILVENFVPTDVSYRFFYYTNFVAIPIVAIGFYALMKRFETNLGKTDLSTQKDTLTETGNS